MNGPATHRRAKTHRPPRLRWGWAGLLAAAAMLAAGCSNSILGGAAGGIPAADARRLSLIVLQTRSQFPELSGTDLPFKARPAPPEDGAKPELALQGDGVSVEPGLQSGEHTRLRAALYLDKHDYALGWLEVTVGDRANERWPIVAYDRRGDPQGEFHFIYVLALPDDRLRYLVLIGGPYEKDGERYHGFEGTLIEPGPGRNLEGWRRGYKLDFGYRFPAVPAHQRKVDQAVQAFRDIRADVEKLESLRRRISKAAGELDALRGARPGPEQADANRKAIADQEKRLEELNTEHDTLVGTTEKRIVAYYGLRKAIATEFAAYTKSNAYLWLDTQGKQAAYDRWKVVEYHHPKIDELVRTFLTHQPDQARVLDARKAAMAEIWRQDNWSKDPARAHKPKQGAPAPSAKKP